MTSKINLNSIDIIIMLKISTVKTEMDFNNIKNLSSRREV